MLELKADDFYHVAARLAEMGGFLQAVEHYDGSEYHHSNALKRSDKTTLKKIYGDLIPHLEILGAEITVVSVDDAIEGLNKQPVTWKDIQNSADDIKKTIRRELKSAILLSLDRRERDYFAPRSPLFGVAFEAKFQTQGVFELDEAAKCMALGRSTAAVFHLMRVMEVGIRAISRCLAIPDPLRPGERSWGPILKNVRDGIDARWPTAANKAHGDGALFDSLYASLDAVKNPWRNGTMHVEDKKTESEAQNIFAAVKGFMMQLAARCDENGLPLA